MRKLFALMAMCALIATPLFAQAQVDEPAPLVQRRVVINFEDEVIESGTQGPLLVVLSAPRRSGHPSIIKVRERFTRRVLLSGNEL